MLKHLLVTALTATLAVGMSYADQSNAKVTIPVNKTSPTSGKQMYSNYCAPCHGVDGRGQGPVAAALKAPPTDLTVLSRNNHGKFPDTHIVTVLQNGAQIASHGTAEMPVWGPILGKMNQTNSQDRMLRISNLSRYLETLQVK
ncbi:MAG TPA: c-type cytochrome [Terracidiphilus sp.]|nr:c-type cytochrome [Terracidiphilus sp.]